jgi:ATP phosphoribosyltransferase regulatory subunit
MTKMREPIQIGAELYGHAGLEADVEIVRLMIESLQRAGIGELHVDLGNPAIYRAMVEGMDGVVAEELFHAVQRKDAVRAGPLAPLTTLNGGPEVLARARKELPAKAMPALQALETLAARCAVAGVEISFDLAELGGFNYESGIVFAAFTPKSPDAIARGGRYDEVGASFGRARPATGFTMDLRQLASLSPTAGQGTARRILAPMSDDAALQDLVKRLRAQGEVVVASLPGHDSAELGCDARLVMEGGKWMVRTNGT